MVAIVNNTINTLHGLTPVPFCRRLCGALTSSFYNKRGCPHAYRKNHTPKLSNFFCAYYVWPWIGSLLAALLALSCTSGFVDDVMRGQE